MPRTAACLPAMFPPRFSGVFARARDFSAIVQRPARSRQPAQRFDQQRFPPHRRLSLSRAAPAPSPPAPQAVLAALFPKPAKPRLSSIVQPLPPSHPSPLLGVNAHAGRILPRFMRRGSLKDVSGFLAEQRQDTAFERIVEMAVVFGHA